MTHRAPPGLGPSQHRRLVDRALLHPRATAALWGTLTLDYLLPGGLRGCRRGCEGFGCGSYGPVGPPARAEAESDSTGAAVPSCPVATGEECGEQHHCGL